MNQTNDAPVAIITGASSGIGLETAKLLDADGWRLALAARTKSKLDDAVASCKNAIAIETDVANPDAVRNLVDETLDAFGRIDALVNNAGYAPLLPIDETTPDILRASLEINALGPGVATNAVWPVFKTQGRGCIVNVSTMATQDPFPGFFAYAGAKAAVNLFAQSAAKEGADHNIRAFSVAPGAVETPMLRSLFSKDQLPESATLAPKDVAEEIVACIKGDRDARNGETIYISA